MMLKRHESSKIRAHIANVFFLLSQIWPNGKEVAQLFYVDVAHYDVYIWISSILLADNRNYW